MKIKFFQNGLITARATLTRVEHLKSSDQSSENPKVDSRSPISLYVNPSFWYLRHFYNLHGKNKQIEWLMPEFFKIYDLE